MSKYLIEAVEGYGDRLINETLYCGMNCPLIMESMSVFKKSNINEYRNICGSELR